MNISREFLKDKKFMPKISFKKSPIHIVKILQEKKETVRTDDGPVDGIKYLVEEEGIQKTIFTGSLSLIEQLSNFNLGETVKISMKTIPGNDGKYRSSYEVLPTQMNVPTPSIGERGEVTLDDDINPDEIPF